MERVTAGAASPPWRAEPFRLFFPLGVAIGWAGIGHWLLYALGVTDTYSCAGHGFVQLEAFLPAFAVGFLLTALPRRTNAPPASTAQLALLAVALVAVAVTGLAERFVGTQLAYLTALGVLVGFARARLAGALGARRPPAAFVLVPIGIVQGVAGAAAMLVAALVRDTPSWVYAAGRLLVEQGVFLCLAMGAGALLLPLMAGRTPPADLDATPREPRRALAYAGLGAGVVLTFALEVAGAPRLAPVLRGLLVAVGLWWGTGAWRGPGRPGLHRRLVWLSLACMPIGLVLSGLLPDYRVPALHVLFIGGFALMAFGVATHVSLAHTGQADVGLGRPPAVLALAAGVLTALGARVAADWSATYFEHLGWAAGCWIAGTAVWLAWIARTLLRRPAA